MHNSEGLANEGSPIVYITEKHARNTTFGLFVRPTCSGWAAGFISTFFNSSKVEPSHAEDVVY